MGRHPATCFYVSICNRTRLTLYTHIKTAQQRTVYSNTVIGTLAVDGWAITFGIQIGDWAG